MGAIFSCVNLNPLYWNFSDKSFKTPPWHTYQIEDSHRLLQLLLQGKHTILSAPTGAGKTWMMLYIIRYYLTHWQMPISILCSRIEVIDQIKDSLVTVLGVSTEAIGTFYNGSPKASRKIAPITLSTYKSCPEFSWKLQIVDEAHHSRARQLEKTIKDSQDCGAVIAGFTATPVRHDQKSLLTLFDEWIPPRDFSEYSSRLCDYIIKSYPVTSLVDVASNQDELFAKKSTFKSSVVNERIATIISDHFESGEITKLLIFASDTSHCFKLFLALESRLKKYGIYCGIVTAKTKKNDRKEILQKFRSGHIKILLNCYVFEDGVDVPDCDGAALIGSFGSYIRYMQAIGRARRKKERPAVILDFSSAVIRHGEANLPRKLDLHRDRQSKTKKCKACGHRNVIPVAMRQKTYVYGEQKTVEKWWVCRECGHPHPIVPKERKITNEPVIVKPNVVDFILKKEWQIVLTIALDARLRVNEKLQAFIDLKDDAPFEIPPISYYIGLRMASKKINDATARTISGHDGISYEELLAEIEGVADDDSD